jgi:hypothetical protein
LFGSQVLAVSLIRESGFGEVAQDVLEDAAVTEVGDLRVGVEAEHGLEGRGLACRVGGDDVDVHPRGEVLGELDVEELLPCEAQGFGVVALLELRRKGEV